MNSIYAMIYPEKFIRINLEFAQKVARLSDQPLTKVLLKNTILYRSFNIGRTFDPQNPVWINYLNSLQNKEDEFDITYKIHAQRQQIPLIDAPVKTFGYFWYEIWAGQKIRIHFNNKSSRDSILSRQKFDTRLKELKQMFADVKTRVNEPTTVVGRTWLYNIKAYRRLFPPSYLDTARICETEVVLPRIALWGQFLDHRGKLKEKLADEFLKRIARADEMQELKKCFPFQALFLEAPIADFYAFYRL